MIYVALIICFLYVLLILYFARGIDRLKDLVCDQNKPVTCFSILVPFRNEAISLPGLLDSVIALDYPTAQFEIILINDASSDASVAIVNRYKEKHPKLNLSLIDNKKQSSSPKKDAINKGISVASNNWILTTDADCIVPKNWLNAFDTMIKQQAPKMIVAPVSYLPKTGFLHKFQLLD
ncbi:glycosyltransferase, partial [Lutimonas sp.]|uniref:glycosyltransferase n=1 Tax=Lutimonas sp. TaxID=1872403 RepID=UPI003C7927B5